MARVKQTHFEGGYDKVNRVITREIGILESAVLGYLVNIRDYYSGKNKLFKGEYFFYTQKSTERYTGLKRKVYQRVLKTLIENGFIETAKFGAPLTMHYKIMDGNIREFIRVASVPKEQCAMYVTDNAQCPKGTMHSVPKEQTLTISKDSISNNKNKKSDALSFLSTEDIPLDRLIEILNKVCGTDNFSVKEYHINSGYRTTLRKLRKAYGNDFILDELIAEKSCNLYKQYLSRVYKEGWDEGIKGELFVSRFVDKLSEYADPKNKFRIDIYENTIVVQDIDPNKVPTIPNLLGL